MLAAAGDLHAEKILIVDDDDTIRKIVAASLKSEGYLVFSAASGQEGMELLKKVQPDLVILDLMLPDADGYDICFAIRKESDIPIVILSAKSEELDKVVGFRMGVDDYVTKPFSSTELALRVKAILRRFYNGNGEKNVPSRVSYGDLEIDLKKREVLIEGEPVKLTTKEFDLLWFLATHPNQVFTREELSNQVWEDYYTGNPGTINVLVCRLRDKIEKNPSNPKYIYTVWGVGYKFVADEAS